jgi:large subunit ribosomal protein L14e
VTGVRRQSIPFKRLSLTDFVVKIPRNARQKVLTKVLTEADIINKWKKTLWYKKKAAARLRAQMNDFERFKVMLAKKRVRIISSEKVRERERESAFVVFSSLCFCFSCFQNLYSQVNNHMNLET